jgi:hypothetical protein
MIRLTKYPTNYSGIRAKGCALLFMATPHSGTVQADWDSFLTGIAALGEVRTEIITDLKSFNGFGVGSEGEFAGMTHVPPHYCICETSRVPIAGKYRLVRYSVSFYRDLKRSLIRELNFRLSLKTQQVLAVRRLFRWLMLIIIKFANSRTSFAPVIAR